MINETPLDPVEVAQAAQVTPPDGARRVRVLLMLLGAAVVGLGAGLLSGAAGNNVPAAVLTAGGAFAGAAGLLLAIARYANPRH